MYHCSNKAVLYKCPAYLFTLLLLGCGGSNNSSETANAGQDIEISGGLEATPANESSMCVYTHPNDPNDDPNPAYDGTNGRYPVTSNAIPDGYPTPLTTGICGVGLVPADLTPSPGLTIENNGEVISRLDITGTVKVMANDVTIRQSRITGSGLYVVQLVSGFSNLTIEDTRIRQDSRADPGPSAVYLQGPATLSRVHITGGSDNLKSNSGNLVVEDSYITGVYRSPGSHNDVFQSRNGSNYTFTGNTMLGPWQMSTSVFLFQAKAGAGGGPISNVLVQGNYFSGGGYTGYTRAPDFPMTNVLITGNVFEADSAQYGYSSNNAGSARWFEIVDTLGVQLD